MENPINDHTVLRYPVEDKTVSKLEQFPKIYFILAIYVILNSIYLFCFEFYSPC